MMCVSRKCDGVVWLLLLHAAAWMGGRGAFGFFFGKRGGKNVRMTDSFELLARVLVMRGAHCHPAGLSPA
jgi:hypothetical protein